MSSTDMTILADGEVGRWDSQSYRQIVSIDPAYVNFAMCIYRVYENGTCVRMLLLKRDFTEGMSDPKALAEQGTIWRNLHACLAEQDALFRESHIFLIERQNSFSFRGALATNPKVMRSFGHLTGAIMARYANQGLHPLIAEVCPKLKGRMLGFGDHLTYAQTKSASVAQVKEFMARNFNDQEGLNILKAAGRKKDDLADTVNQWRGWVRRFPEALGFATGEGLLNL